MGCEDKVTIEVLGQKELSRIAKDEIDVPLALSTFRDNVKSYSALSDGKRRTNSLSLLLIMWLGQTCATGKEGRDNHYALHLTVLLQLNRYLGIV